MERGWSLLTWAFVLCLSHSASASIEKTFVMAQGRPRLGVQFSQNAVHVSFSVNLAQELKGKSVTRMTLNFISPSGVELLSEPLALLNKMNEMRPVMISGDQAFSIEVKDGKAAELSKGLKNMAMIIDVYSEQKKLLTALLNLGQICKSHPDNFIDLETGKAGCSP